MYCTRIRVLVLGLFVSVLACCCGESVTAQLPDPVKPSPEELARIAKQAGFATAQKLEGKITLIQFGSAVGCELSNEGLEWMIMTHDGELTPGLGFLRVELSDTSDEALAALVKDKEIKFPLYADRDKSVATAFQGTAMPTYVLVGKYGRVRYRGKLPDERIDQYVEVLQGEKADPGVGVALFGAVKLDGPRLLAQTELPNLKNEKHKLADSMGKAGLMVVFVDTTCPFAGQALKDLPTVTAKLTGHRINSVVVSVGDPAETVKERFAKFKANAAILFDETPGVESAWNVQSVPTVVYFDPSGRIAYNGSALWEEVGKKIEAARGYKAGTIKFGVTGTGMG